MNEKECPYCGSTNLLSDGRRFVQGVPTHYKHQCRDCGKYHQVAITALEHRASALGIDPSTVSRVKYWETPKGEPRMSVTQDMPKVSNEALLQSFADVARAVVISDPVQIISEVTGASAILVTSDRHFGMGQGQNPMYAALYGEAQIRDQNSLMLDRLKEEVRRRKGAFEELAYVDLGDALHGYGGKTVRGGHDLETSMDTREQFEAYLRQMSWLLRSLYASGVARRYKVVLLTNDNHAGDFGYLAARALQIMVQAQLPEMTFEVITQFIHHIVVGEHTYMLTHGKDKQYMMRPLPGTVNSNTEALVNKYMMHHGIRPGATLLKGDVHHPSTTYGRSFRYKNVVPGCGSSERDDVLYGSQYSGFEYEIVQKGEILQTSTVFYTI